MLSFVDHTWCLSVEENTWEELETTGNKPGYLQDHSMVSYNQYIYVFGGEISFCNDLEVPLWKYHKEERKWEKIPAGNSSQTPKGLRGHCMVLFENKLLVYGGYQELLGSSGDLWSFDLSSDHWSKITQVTTTNNAKAEF